MYVYRELGLGHDEVTRRKREMPLSTTVTRAMSEAADRLHELEEQIRRLQTENASLKTAVSSTPTHVAHARRHPSPNRDAEVEPIIDIDAVVPEAEDNWYAYIHCYWYYLHAGQAV